MILAVAYVILSAKPISIRRLFMLYVFSTVTAFCFLAAFHAEHAAKLAPQIAIVVTLAVWSFPVVRVLYGAFRGQIGLEAFEPVSGCVQATYGFTTAIAFAAGAKAFVVPFDALTFAALFRLVVLGMAVGIGFAFLVRALRNGPREAFTRRGAVHHNSITALLSY